MEKCWGRNTHRSGSKLLRGLRAGSMCRTTSPYPTAVTPDSFYSEGLDFRCLCDASQAMDVGKNGGSCFALFVTPLNKTKLKHLKTCPLQKEVLLARSHIQYNVEVMMRVLIRQELRIRLHAHHRDPQVCSCRLCCLRILGYFGSNISSPSVF